MKLNAYKEANFLGLFDIPACRWINKILELIPMFILDNLKGQISDNFVGDMEETL